eukprot:COSAG03_NODE_1869_length_3406_cov_4.948594_1_plen_83_part_10
MVWDMMLLLVLVLVLVLSRCCSCCCYVVVAVVVSLLRLHHGHTSPRYDTARTACVAPKSAGRALRSAGRGKRVIFAQMAGLLA